MEADYGALLTQELSARQTVFLEDARKLSATEAREELARYKDMRLRRWALMYYLVVDHRYSYASLARLIGITNAAARNALLGFNTKKSAADDAA